MNKDSILRFCDRLTAWSFYLLAAAVTLSNALTEIASAVIITMFILKRVINRDYSLPGGRLSYILILFTAWNLVSFINTSYLFESIRGFFKVLKHFLIFIAVIDHFRSPRQLKRLLFFALGVGFLISLNGIVQYISGTDLIRARVIDPLDYLHRVSSSFKHSNDFGAYLVVMITVMVSLFFSSGRLLRERALLVAAAAPVIWCLFATSSRGAWMGLAIALVFLAIIKSRRLFILIVVLLLISPVFLPSSVKARFSDLYSAPEKGGTVWERMELWSGTISMIKEHPVAGFGVNTYTKNFPDYKPKDYPDVRYTHNSYLHMASETGITGAAIFIVFIITFIVSVIRKIGVFKKGSLSRDLFLGLSAGIIGFFAHSAVDTHFYSVTLSAFLFLCLGLAASYARGPCDGNA